MQYAVIQKEHTVFFHLKLSCRSFVNRFGDISLLSPTKKKVNTNGFLKSYKYGLDLF